MCLALVLTAARLGATVANYTRVTQLVKTADGFVTGAHVQDEITGTLVGVDQRSANLHNNYVCFSCFCLAQITHRVIHTPISVTFGQTRQTHRGHEIT